MSPFSSYGKMFALVGHISSQLLCIEFRHIVHIRQILFSYKMIKCIEQRYCIKLKLFHKIQQAFDDDAAISLTQIKVWYNHFKYGHTAVESETRSGMPTTNQHHNPTQKFKNYSWKRIK